MTRGSSDPGPPDAGDSTRGVACAQMIAEVWTLLDGECTPETCEKLRHHLEKCPACLRRYGIEERIKALIAHKCGGDKAPQHLVERLRLQISRTTIIRGG